MRRKLFLASVVLLLPGDALAADLSTDFTFIEESVSMGPVGPTVLLEAYGGYNWIDSDAFAASGNEDEEFWLYGGWTGVNIPVVGASGVQFEIFGEGTTAEEGGAANNYTWSAGGGAHVYWRESSRGLIGVMGGAFYTENDFESEDNAWAWLAGLEAQAYLGMTTLYGQAGYATYVNSGPNGSQDDDFPRDVIFVRGVARHFFGDYTKVEGEVGAAFGKYEEAPEMDFYLINWGLEAEHAFTGQMPISVFVRYEGIYADDEEDYSLDTTIKLGLRGRFGGAAESLYANDRQGVSLDLPDVGRWGGVIDGPIN